MIIISFWATFNILFRLLRLQYIKEDPFGPSVTAIEVNYSNLDRTAPCRVVVAFFAPVQPTHTLCVIAAGFLPIDSGAAKKKIDAYCVITTYRGTIYHESFKNSKRAANYLDAVEKAYSFYG